MLKKNLPHLLALLVCGPLAATIASAALTATPQITAEEIVQKNASARGGLVAWRAVHSMKMTGQMDAGKGVELPFVLDLERPRKMRLELQFDGKIAKQVYDGVNGWKVRPYLGHDDTESYTADELKQAAMQSELDGPLLDHSAKGVQVALEGSEKVEDHEAYKLRLTMKDQQVRHVWIDARTFLEVRIDGTRRMDGKMRTMYTYYRNYKPVKGLMVPYLLETSVDGVKQREKIKLDIVNVNARLDDRLFAKP
jgi:outer membrane lipoprotein-sorting protein